MKLQQLNRLCYIRNGHAFKSKDFISKGIPIVRIGEIKDGLVSLENAPHVEENKSHEKYSLKKGDILIAMSGATTGKVGRYEQDVKAYQNQRVGCLIPRTKELDSNYLFQWLKSITKEVIKKAYGGGQPNISSKNLGDLRIPIPKHFNDQKRIAQVLTDCEDLIAKRKESIALLDELIKSTFLELFGDPLKNEKGWKVMPMSKVVIDITSGTSYGGESKEELDNDEFGVLKISAVTKGVLNLKEFKAVKKSEVKKKLIFLKKDMLLLGRANTRELVAACCIVPEDFPNYFLPDKLWSLEINEKLAIKPFLNHLFKNENFRNTIRKKASGGHDSMLNVSMTKFRALNLIIPPIEKQIDFSAIVRKVEEIKKLYQNHLTELENLYGRLSQDAFKGELDLSKVVLREEFLSTGQETEAKTSSKSTKRAKKTWYEPIALDLSTIMKVPMPEPHIDLTDGNLSSTDYAGLAVSGKSALKYQDSVNSFIGAYINAQGPQEGETANERMMAQSKKNVKMGAILKDLSGAAKASVDFEGLAKNHGLSLNFPKNKGRATFLNKITDKILDYDTSQFSIEDLTAFLPKRKNDKLYKWLNSENLQDRKEALGEIKLILGKISEDYDLTVKARLTNTFEEATDTIENLPIIEDKAQAENLLESGKIFENILKKLENKKVNVAVGLDKKQKEPEIKPKAKPSSVSKPKWTNEEQYALAEHFYNPRKKKEYLEYLIIESFEDQDFTFENIKTLLSLHTYTKYSAAVYDEWKNSFFELLNDETSEIDQFFDEKDGKIKFRLEP